MKTKKNSIFTVIALAVIAVAFALPAKAQITPYTYFNVDWQFNAPLGNDFAKRASGWGANIEGGYYILPDLAIGAFVNYSTNNKYVSKRTIALNSTTAINTDQEHSLFQLPFGMTAHYRFMDGMVQPYIGAKIGAEYSKMSSDFLIYQEKDDTWGFYMSPEIGLYLYPWEDSVGFHIAAYYSYATNKGQIFDYKMDNRSNIGFRVGVAF